MPASKLHLHSLRHVAFASPTRRWVFFPKWWKIDIRGKKVIHPIFYQSFMLMMSIKWKLQLP
jgi:hypothetical protein